MKIRTVQKSTWWALAFVLAGGLSLCSPAAQAQAPAAQDSPEVTKLLKQARGQAVQLQRGADRLESYKHSNLSRQTHASQLNTTKEHVNDLGKTLDQLEARQAQASAWQRRAIAEMRPMLEQLAGHTTDAIEHINQNPHQVRHPDYHDTLSAKSDLSTQLADLLNDYLAYGEAKANLENAEARVGSLL